MKRRLLLLIVSVLCSMAYAGAQQITVSGKVTDEEGNPLPGTAVLASESGEGTITDGNGDYSISLKKASDLVFEFLGFEPQTVRAEKSRVLNITLRQDATLLEELVVVGYGTQKKANLTGSVATVNFDEKMSSRPVVNASTALTGLSAGVQVQQASGKPGDDSGTIRVRGTGTLNSNNPLVLVDGIEWNMNHVNTEDIASITVLKDAASAAIYGSRAANGVILVTTKQGTGKPKINYSMYCSFLEAQNKLSFVSDYARHMELINEGAENMGKGAPFADTTIETWKNAAANPYGLNEYGTPNYMAYPNTNWFDEVVGTGFSHKHNLSVSGSSDRVTYYVSLGYLDTEGIMNKKGLDSGMDQFQFRTNLEVKINKWVKVGTQLNGLKQNKGLANIDNCFEYLGAAIPGIYPGEENKWGVPAAVEESTGAANLFSWLGRRGYDKQFRGNFTLYGVITPIKGLSIEGKFNYAPYWQDYCTYGFPNGKWNYVTNTRESETSLETASVTMKAYRQNKMNSEVLARYNATFAEDHSLNLLAGFTTSSYKESSFQTSKKGMSDWSLIELSTLSEVTSSTSSSADWALMSFFGRVNYAYKDKYLFEANVRYDGSSRFAPESRWGLFPSFSAGWNIHKEDFMSGTKDWLSNLKIRASWGKMGNNASGNYDWQATYYTDKVVLGGDLATGLHQSKLANTALEWETTTTSNIGIDYGFFSNRLSGEIDLYNKLTTGILYTPSIPMTMGNVTAATENIASVRNRGIELSLSWRDTKGDFNYSIGGNFAFNANKVLSYKGRLVKEWRYDEAGNATFYSNWGDVSQSGFGGYIVEDHMIGEMYMHTPYTGKGNYAGGTPGLDQGPKDGMIRTEADMAWVKAMIDAGYKFNGVTTVAKDQLWYGDMIYADANGDGNYGDTHDMNFTGTSKQPLYNFGINFSASWKGLDFYMLWAGSAGFDLYWYDATLNGTRVKNGYSVATRIADNHYFYNPENPEDSRTNLTATYPRLTLDSAQSNGTKSTFYKYRGDYIKLKNVQIGYSLPDRWMKAIHLSKVRFYVSGENLLTITQYPGLDPEMGTSVTYPLTRQYAIGAQITF